MRILYYTVISSFQWAGIATVLIIKQTGYNYIPGFSVPSSIVTLTPTNKDSIKGFFLI